MLAIERRNGIAELARDRGSVTVAELSKRFDVTEETIRKDLEKLEAEGRVKREHGGAIGVGDPGAELPFAVRNAVRQEEKRRIAEEAAKLVADGEVIALDASSTCLQLAARLKDRRELTVVTNSLQIVHVLKDSPGVAVFCTGGILRTPSYCFVGESAEEMIGKYVIGKAFLSTRGLTLDNGLLEPNEQEARMKKTIIRAARELMLLLDYSKFGQTAFYPIARIDQVHTLVTDDQTPESYAKAFEQQGAKVIVAAAARN
ncbi:DeoR/GlpR family DNA-binding transcription regulator [Paenibacillus cymbidii]|uniref:DeoR/GlpR family DNA-binding transcription regulator n=1 Tax=Paenibacillus cymbidii TaxID=1639034 RepID=UPI001081A6D8|nr:DeoR/GlpR family DNA-binding transcription regulator [Paenibacillus cymbidii]